MNITWLTQGGFLFQSGSTRVVVDPYLSDCVERRQGLTRLVEPPLSVEELQPDAMVCTHDHMDHFDPQTIPRFAALYPNCLFLGPASVRRHLHEISIAQDRVLPFDVGRRVKIEQFSLSAMPAFHSNTDAIGLVIETGGQKIYLTGDTELTSQLLDAAKAMINDHGVDLLLVCINGKWGNMNIEDAVRLAEVIQPGLAVPMHYGLFAENTVEPVDFIEQCRKNEINAICLHIGREVQLSELLRGVES
ncbi:MAG: MBL fold metallo-hydrolase [Phycisphaerae bacterium]|nr:MBL fold metallo-hydrolase [Phycisphaerae bacterium]